MRKGREVHVEADWIEAGVRERGSNGPMHERVTFGVEMESVVVSELWTGAR